jgi:uncharacterized protein with von Willebrand factor type A (vWA) domain
LKFLTLNSLNGEGEYEDSVQNERLIANVNKLIDEVEWAASAFKVHKEKVGIPK